MSDVLFSKNIHFAIDIVTLIVSRVEIRIMRNESIAWRCYCCRGIGETFLFLLFSFNRLLCFEGTISEVKADPEEEPTPSNNTGAGEALLMNNGSRDTSHSDIQKLQQQLQDIKEQVRVSSASRFVMRRFNETNNLICVEERSPHRALYNYPFALEETGIRFLGLYFKSSCREHRNNFNFNFFLVFTSLVSRKIQGVRS